MGAWSCALLHIDLSSDLLHALVVGEIGNQDGRVEVFDGPDDPAKNHSYFLVVLIIIAYNLDHRVREARQAVLKVAEDSDKDDGIDSLLESGEGRFFILLFDELQLPHSEVAEKKYKSWVHR